MTPPSHLRPEPTEGASPALGSAIEAAVGFVTAVGFVPESEFVPLSPKPKSNGSENPSVATPRPPVSPLPSVYVGRFLLHVFMGVDECCVCGFARADAAGGVAVLVGLDYAACKTC